MPRKSSGCTCDDVDELFVSPRMRQFEEGTMSTCREAVQQCSCVETVGCRPHGSLATMCTFEVDVPGEENK